MKMTATMNVTQQARKPYARWTMVVRTLEDWNKRLAAI
jgi:hypothetical protein